MAKCGSNLSINLSAIAYRDEGMWLAHCLELDIVAEGKNVDDAFRSLISLCNLQIKVALEEGDLQSIFRPAPPEVWTLFTAGKRKILAGKKTQTQRRDGFTTPVDRFEARELAFA
jgi:hypothetical protein